MKNTRNDIEALAADREIELTGYGSDTDGIEAIAAAEAVAMTYRGNDDNLLEKLTAALDEG